MNRHNPHCSLGVPWKIGEMLDVSSGCLGWLGVKGKDGGVKSGYLLVRRG